MKNTKTIMREAQEHHQDDEFRFYANAERNKEISRATYLRACMKAGAEKAEALEWLRENYQRAGIGHLY